MKKITDDDSLIKRGEAEGLISFDGAPAKKSVTYHYGDGKSKKRNYENPEERVQVITFLKLVLDYGYSASQIDLYTSVVIGSSSKEADIIVYNDDEHQNALIVVECKKEEASERELIQAAEQAFSYAATGTVRARYFWVTSKIKNSYFEIPIKEPKTRRPIADIPHYGVSGVVKFKYVKGGVSATGGKMFDIVGVEENDLTRRFKQAHNALWGGGELNPSEAFDELDKLIFCKIWDEKKRRKKGEPYDFQVFTENTEEKTNKTLKERILKIYEEGRNKDPEVFKDDIRLTPEKLRTVVGYLEGINLSETDLDCKGRAFETFMGSFFRGDFGQFFTPRNIVEFIVGVLPINGDSLVLDTSCGSGGFLLHALEKVRQQAAGYYPDEIPSRTAKEGGAQYYRYWHSFAEKNLFGIEINEQIARTAKMNMIIHDDGHTNVIAADGLLPIEEIESRSKNNGFCRNRFDFIITNPPFGSVIRQTERAYMHQYSFAYKGADWLNPNSREAIRANQNTEILFIEQCHNFLREGGYLAIVIPDGVLTNSSLQYVRDGIEEKFRIVAVVSLPQTAFQATGAGVKSSVLFLKKHDEATTDNIKGIKESLQKKIKKDNDYSQQLDKIESDKKRHIQELRGFDNAENLEGEALRQSVAYKEWKKAVSDEYREMIGELKESMEDKYTQEKSKDLDDYPIFMAIAEDIGYDATGRETGNNELKIIGKELARFIEAIEREK